MQPKEPVRSPEVVGFLGSLRIEKAAARTLQSYQVDLDQFAGWLAVSRSGQAVTRIDLGGVTPLTVRQFLGYLERQGFSRRTVARKISCLRSLYRYLFRQGLVGTNPTAEIRTPRAEPVSANSVAELDMSRMLELPDLTTVSGLRDKALLEVLYATGLRVGELVRLNLHTIDFEAGWLTVCSPDRRERSVPVGRQALVALAAYSNDGRPHLLAHAPASEQALAAREQPLFLNKSGSRLSDRGVRRILEGYGRRLALDNRVTPQSVRQAFAMHLLDHGAALEAVQEMLGHASPATTQLYARSNARPGLRETYAKAHPRQAGGRGNRSSVPMDHDLD